MSQLSEEEVRNIYMITSVLEGLATRLATPHLQEGPKRGKLLKLYEELKNHHKARDVDAYWAVNRNFHRFITQASDNRQLENLIDNLRRQILKTRVITLSYPGRLDASMAEHEEILDAIMKGDARRAESLVINHLEIQGQFILDLVRP